MAEQTLIDTVRLKESLDIVEVIKRYIPLKKDGAEWAACCPFHNEATPSFKVSPSKQIFHCFGCGAAGDVIRFVQDYERVDFVTACELLQAGISNSPPRDTQAPPKKKPAQWTPILPVPETAHAPPREHKYRGAPEAIYPYLDRDGRPLGYVYRCLNSEGGKEPCPLVWARNERGETMWRWQAFPEPRPLYGLNRLAGRDSVLLVEGEKCADYGQRAQEDFAVVTWPGGCGAVGKTDFSPLAGRMVVIWPDCDSKRVKLSKAEIEAGADPEAQPYRPETEQPGMKAALQIVDILLALDPPANVFMVPIPSPGLKKDGWDIADAIEAGLTGEALVKHIRGTAQPATSRPAPPAVKSDEGGEAKPPRGRGKSGGEAPGGDQRPEIRLGGGRLVDAMREAANVLFRRGEDPPYFQRGGMGILQWVNRVDRERVRHGEKEIIKGALCLQPVTSGWLRARMMEEIRFTRWHDKAEAYLDVNLPKEYTESYLERGEYWAPVLRAVVEAPFIRQDGTVSHKPGFDPRSGVYLDLDPTIDWPLPPARKKGEVIDPVTDKYLVKARHVLWDLFESFRPETMVDVSVLVAMLLTAVQKSELGATPGFMVSAPTPGAGKGKIVDIIGMIATGRAMPMAPMPADGRGNVDAKEFRQSMGTQVMNGDKFIVIDEVRGTLNDAVLNSFMTQQSVPFRILGASKMAMLRPTESIYVALGNNCKVHADAGRRWLGAYIVPGVARTEERENLRDTPAYARENRGKLVCAALTVLHSYMHMGSPAQEGARLGSYETWASKIVGAMMWAKLGNPIESQQRWREHDEGTARLAALLEAWYYKYRDPRAPAGLASQPMPAGEVCKDVGMMGADVMDIDGDIRDAVLAVAGDKGGANVNKLGAFLKAHTKAVVRGAITGPDGKERPADLWVEPTGERKHAKLWTVFVTLLQEKM